MLGNFSISHLGPIFYGYGVGWQTTVNSWKCNNSQEWVVLCCPSLGMVNCAVTRLEHTGTLSQSHRDNAMLHRSPVRWHSHPQIFKCLHNQHKYWNISVGVSTGAAGTCSEIWNPMIILGTVKNIMIFKVVVNQLDNPVYGGSPTPPQSAPVLLTLKSIMLIHSQQ